MKLLIVRHAVAMERSDYQLAARSVGAPPDAKDASDDLRPLTVDGQRKMKKAARGLGRVLQKPILLISSPLKRAHQTSEILSEQWGGLAIETCKLLSPDSKLTALAKWLNDHVDCKDDSHEGIYVVVGHEPHLSKFVSWCVVGSGVGLQSEPIVELKKGGACLVEFGARVAKGQGFLRWLVLPSHLRAMAR